MHLGLFAWNGKKEMQFWVSLSLLFDFASQHRTQSQFQAST